MSRPATIRVLHVDDEPGFAELAAEHLTRESERIDVETVDSAAAALDSLSAGSFDCVISDYDMPATTGLELLREVRARYDDLPFVLFTGKGSEEIASEAISAGVTDYIQKGTGTDQYALLANRVENAVSRRNVERAFEDENRKLTALFQYSPDAIVEYYDGEDGAPVIANVNPAFEETFGYDPDGIVGERIDDVVTPDDRQDEASRLNERARAERQLRAEVRRLTDDGIRDFLVTTIRLPVSDPELDGFAIYTDVTEARERERRLRTLISNLPGIAYRCRKEPGWPMEFVGGDCEELTGYRAEDLESGSVSWGEDVIYPDDQESVWRPVQDAVEDHEPFRVTYRIRTRDGETRCMWEQGRGVYDENGDLEALEGFITDITDRKRLERKLRDRESSMRDLSQIASDPDLTFEDKLDRILALGADHLELPLGFLARVEDDDATIERVHGDAELLPSGESRPLERTYCREPARADGPVAVSNASTDERVADREYERFGFETYVGCNVTVDGEPYGVLCFADEAVREESFADAELTFVEVLARWLGYELTGRRQRHRLEAQNSRLDRFTGLVSHDLRNPLNVAEAELSMALETGDLNHVEGASEALDRMEALVTDMLTLAREGESVTGTEPVSLAGVAREAWREVGTEAATMSVAADPTIEADPNRLRTLLSNLFRNSVEHGTTNSDPGVRRGGVEHVTAGPNRTAADAEDDDDTEPSLAITVGATDGGFYVEDDGVGIPPDDRDSVFEAGYTTDPDGTGYGLSIVEEIATSHGWSMTLAESEDGGVRFEFR